MTELFEPNLEEIEAMIKEIEARMEDADSLAEWKELQYQLDELLERQKQLLKEQETISTSYLQRRFRIGFNRAALMILLLAHAVYILKLFDIFRKENTLLIALIGLLLSAICWRQDIMWGIVTLTYTSFVSIILITLYYDDIDDL